MEKIVVDASVIAKWYIEERYSDKAVLLQKEYIDRKIEIIVPSLMYFEVLNVLRYSLLFNQSELKSIGESLEKYGFTVLYIKGDVRNLMIDLSVEHQLSIYDAAYVALSVSMGVSLCTSDEKIIKKLPNRFRKKIILLRSYSL